MTPATKRLSAFALAALLTAPDAVADRIYRTSGTPLEDVEVTEETVTRVLYKEGGRGKELSIPSEEIVRIEYERLPRLIGEAAAALEEEAMLDALDLYRAYLDEVREREDRRFPWAAAYAAHRILSLQRQLGDHEGARAAAAGLLERFPDSRYVPSAFIAKANAEYRLGQFAEAQRTLKSFEELIVSKNLSQRWTLECRLSQVLTDDSLSGEARRGRLRQVEQDASREFPTVRTRAAVARAESLVAESVRAEGGGSAGALSQARELFEDVASDRSADEEALAASFTGIGECAFRAADGDQEELRRAMWAFMRVVVLYEDQTRYVPKAMFYAGRCFDLLGTERDKERAKELYLKVIRDYGGTTWAQEAKNFAR